MVVPQTSLDMIVGPAAHDCALSTFKFSGPSNHHLAVVLTEPPSISALFQTLYHQKWCESPREGLNVTLFPMLEVGLFNPRRPATHLPFWTGDVETHEYFVTYEVAADTVVFTVKSWLRNTVTRGVRHSPAAASQP